MRVSLGAIPPASPGPGVNVVVSALIELGHELRGDSLASFAVAAVAELRGRSIPGWKEYIEVLTHSVAGYWRAQTFTRILEVAAQAGELELVMECRSRFGVDAGSAVSGSIKGGQWHVVKYLAKDVRFTDADRTYCAVASGFDPELRELAAACPAPAWKVAQLAAWMGNVAVLEWAAANGWDPATDHVKEMRDARKEAGSAEAAQWLRERVPAKETPETDTVEITDV